MQSQEEHTFKVSLGYSKIQASLTSQSDFFLKIQNKKQQQTIWSNLFLVLFQFVETRTDYDSKFCNLDVFV